MSIQRLRQLSREYFPQWSRKQRARWVRAKLIAPDPKVGTAREVLLRPENYQFARGSR